MDTATEARFTDKTAVGYVGPDGERRGGEEAPAQWAPEEYEQAAWGPETPLGRQVGGDHYRGMAIQPVEFIERNRLTFCEGNVIKYICRHSRKGGAADIRKAIHYAELLLAVHYPGEGK